MSVQPDFLAQGDPSAFLNQPGFLEQGPSTFEPTPPLAQDRTLLKVAVGIAGAVVLLRMLMKSGLLKESPKTPEEVQASANRVYKRVFPFWMQAVVPAIAQAYKLGSTSEVSYDELQKLAEDYATELGDYVHQSSVEALLDGFNAQMNGGWSERLAWVRAANGYGLDKPQMKSYIKGVTGTKVDYETMPVPAAAQAAVDRAFLWRADRLGQNEAFKASQVGRNLVWLSLEASNQLPLGCKKRWVTAEDERVCKICGPLDQVALPLADRFESEGLHFYAPGVHPNCRCEIELVYPDESDEYSINVSKARGGDPYDRDRRGRFSVNESRLAKPKEKVNPFAETQQSVSPFGARTSLSVNPFDLEEEEQLTEQLADLVSNTNPFASPFAQASEGTNPFLYEEKKAKPKVKVRQRAIEQVEENIQELTQEQTNDNQHVYDPWEPQEHDGVAMAYGDRFLGMNQDLRKKILSSVGTGTIIDFSKDDSKAGIVAFASGMGAGGSTGDPVAPFEHAFDDFYEYEGRFREDLYRRSIRDHLDDPKNDFVRYQDLVEDVDGDELDALRKLLANKSKPELISDIIHPLSLDPDALYNANVAVGDESALFDPNATATEVAADILRVAKFEIEQSESTSARLDWGSPTPWASKVLDYESENDDGVPDEDIIFAQQAVLEDGSPGFERQPVFFRVRDAWYGTIDQTDVRAGSVNATLMGKYRVAGVYRQHNIPDSFSEASDIRKFVPDYVVVDLELVGK